MRSRSVDPEKAAVVTTIVESGNYKVYFETMEPMRGRSKTFPSTDSWSIEVKEGWLYSNLPYQGEAYFAMPGVQDGLTFDSGMTGYEIERGRKGELNVSFGAKSDDDRYDYHLTFYPDGNVYLRVIPNFKTSVGFDGKLKM